MTIKPHAIPFKEMSDYFIIDLTSKTGLRRIRSMSPTAKEGGEAGTYHRTGYYFTMFHGVRYNNSRIIYALANQCDPGEMHIDHIDRNKSNNDPSNLRLVTNRVNQQNRVKQSGLPVGVWFDKKRKRYVARTRINGKQKQLGRYRTSEEAADAYMQAQLLAIADEQEGGNG
jgi:hypothetical protein